MQVSYITQISWNRYINIKITKINEYKGVHKSFKIDDTHQRKIQGMKGVYTKQTLQIDQKGMIQKLLKIQGSEDQRR